MLNFIQNLTVVLFLVICINIFVHGGTEYKRVKRIVGGKAAAKPPPDDPVVFTRMYNRDARIEGFRNEKTGVYSFLGLRFADPPVGQNRFARPRYRRLEGDINATVHGPPCPQPHPQNTNIVIGNEDCLCLDIYTPRMPDESTGLPVFVWIHPGGFRYGSAAQYNAEPIAQGGVIFVPVQYRLGTLGIIGDGTKEFAGNLAMFDMAAALRWVTEYIAFFGGDPKQVKVIGHGSGAASAMYLTMSRLPRTGSISGVVAMSGSALSQYAIDTEPVQSLREIAEVNSCSGNNETEIISCLRTKPISDIVLKDSQVQVERLSGRGMIKGIAGSVGFNPHVEIRNDERALPGVITVKPEESLKEGNFSTIPLLIGVAKQETGNAISLNVITSVWGTAEKFLSFLAANLYSLKSFLKFNEPIDLLTNSSVLGSENIRVTLGDILKISDSLTPQIISKVVELTTDALFNLPAIISAQMWGKTSSAYFYSFEYNGSISKGRHFLSGLPIVSSLSGKRDNVVGHGDDLGYIFDANDIEGNPLRDIKITNPEEIQVRENFLSLLLKFASLDEKENSIFQNALIGEKGIPFIRISNKLDLLNDFRFCELSPWGLKLNPVQAPTCQALDSLNTLKSALRNVTLINEGIDKIDNFSLINEPFTRIGLFG